MEIKERVEKLERRYDFPREIPDWNGFGRGTVEKLISRGALQGDGKGLDLSHDMLRIFVAHDRLGLYK